MRTLCKQTKMEWGRVSSLVCENARLARAKWLFDASLLDVKLGRKIDG